MFILSPTEKYNFIFQEKIQMHIMEFTIPFWLIDVAVVTEALSLKDRVMTMMSRSSEW
jgi:hypothetical protein